jgi:hypothetical protein
VDCSFFGFNSGVVSVGKGVGIGVMCGEVFKFAHDMSSAQSNTPEIVKVAFLAVIEKVCLFWI